MSNVYLNESTKFEIEIIVAQLNAKSVRVFINDFLSHVGICVIHGGVFPKIKINEEISRNNRLKVDYEPLASDIMSIHRISAVKHKTNYHNWIVSILGWLAEEHRVNGRVWFDDTPIGLLPIRKRKS